ncbi:SIR2 family protein [Cytobacillus firmus]|uniref:SIR2 family protein n=1 Tax=Cytobacillus firmus TaxID=1399 RepID=UPI00202F062F|nr:SIR2 family protein [Cytobacillus firmus]URT72720.1 SIR2 family protein [Cytobacillus firmus]
MEKIYQHIRDLTKASKNGKLVFFVGAGISRISDYPQWGELVNEYNVQLYGKPKEGDYSSDEYLRIPQIFYDVEGEEAYDKVLENVFSVDKSTNPIHDKILAMNPVHIITTNYDNLLEKACWQRGRYFSVISAEEDIAKATSSRNLLKIHGDFKRGFRGKYVVLKESDYINYEQNFPLISNYMKTIMATHNIVFIGYGLGDYNINLIMNWVRQLQKDGYNKPFFIRVDHKPIEEKTAVYYESKGLRIIDAASLVNTEENEYLKRYEKVMDILIDSKDNALISNDDDVIDYLNEKLSPLFVLQNVRKLDLKHVFNFDYHFEVNGTVVPNKNTGFGYMERFFELKEKGTDNLNGGSKQKFEAISNFYEQNGILCMYDDLDNKTINNTYEIKSPAYHGDYDEMERLIQITSISLEEEYRKAFYLACLGRWEEAYNYYSNLLLKSIDESNWWIHYLSQINRYRLYQSITQSAKHLRGAGLLIYGRYYRPFSDEFLKRIEREMKNFNINDVFSGMPYDFQEKYQILEFLSDNKFLYDDTVKLFSLTSKIRSEISKGSHSFGSLTSDLKVQFRLNDNLRFLYENCLWSAFFDEIKQYTRNSLLLMFEKAEYEQTRDIDDFGFFMGVGKSGFYVDYYDFVNVARSFRIDDIKHIERSCKVEQIEFSDTEKIENYLISISNEIIKQFSNDSMSIIFYNQIISEAKVAFYFARYVKLSENGFIKILRALLFYFPERELDIGKRYLWIDRLTRCSGLPNAAITMIEEFLINQVDKHKDSEFSEQSTNGLFSNNFCNLILHFEKEFVSKELSNYALSLSKDADNQFKFMYQLSPILSIEAKNYLSNLRNIEDIKGLMDSVKVGLVDNISVYQDLIIKYMDTYMSTILDDRRKGIKQIYSDNYAVKFGIWYFLGELTDLRMKDYLGVIDEYDFFVDPEVFDYEKFRPIWLKNYGDKLLEKIIKNEYMRPQVIEILKERIKNTNDKKYLEIFIKHIV